MELSVEHLELAPVIDNALTILKERAARGGVAVSRHLAADVATIAAEPATLPALSTVCAVATLEAATTLAAPGVSVFGSCNDNDRST